MIVSSEREGNRKLFELTDSGRAVAAEIQTPPWEQFAEDEGDSELENLRTALRQLIGAVAQSAYAFTDEQQQRVLGIVKKARSDIYGLLAKRD